ncbi:hypothetical protein L1987_64159 [Smallanthus sonchifolius]|uniref:Uncharacterized protein n=1 Tax=Smallanthus sonchifolius TaxID=185202 RepID=A0ACB9CF56_9ASTR|nr:hypothetical protein L1987_64159 [Smallanthus sonchifolius]
MLIYVCGGGLGLGVRRGWDAKENNESLSLRSDTPGKASMADKMLSFFLDPSLSTKREGYTTMAYINFATGGHHHNSFIPISNTQMRYTKNLHLCPEIQNSTAFFIILLILSSTHARFTPREGSNSKLIDSYTQVIDNEDEDYGQMGIRNMLIGSKPPTCDLKKYCRRILGLVFENSFVEYSIEPRS